MKTHTWLWWGVALVLICSCGRKPAPQAAAAPPRRAATHLQRERMPRPPIEPETVVTATPSQRLVVVHVTARGVPAPGVAVTLEAWREYAAFLHTASDSKGVARLLLPPRAQTLRIIAVHPRYAMVACQTNLAVGTTPLELALNLDQPGVVITAELHGPGADAVTQCFARIMPASWHGWNAVGGALASNCLDHHISFPAIAAGLSNLRVSVQAASITPAVSALFDTADGRDKTIIVESLPGVRVRGRALRGNGTPVASFRLIATPRGRYEANDQPGHRNDLLRCAADGSYGPITLLPDFYRLSATCSEAQGVYTNAQFTLDDNVIDFVFPEYTRMTVRGQVLYADSRQPAPGVAVQWKTGGRDGETNSVTDAAGRFALVARGAKWGPVGQLVVQALDYAHVEMPLYEYAGEELVILLRPAATIIGKVVTEDRTPARGVTVQVYPRAEQDNVERPRSVSRFMQGDDDRRRQWDSYWRSTDLPSNEQGEFVISNVAAPQVYEVSAHHEDYMCLGINGTTNQQVLLSLTPGETRYCEVLMRTKPVVMIKVVDRNGQPVVKYQLVIEVRADGGRSQSSQDVIAAASEWYRLPIERPGARAILALNATLEDGSCAQTNGIECTAFITHVIMVAQDLGTNMFRGYIYGNNGNPQDDLYVHAFAEDGRMFAYAQTDPLGFFQLPALRVSAGTLVNLNVSLAQQTFSTNVVFLGTPVEWILPEPRTVRGRVCIGTPDTPATNFSIALMQPFNARHFTAPDGRFRMAVDPDEDLIERQFTLYASVENYAPVEVACDQRTTNDLDVGDIIVQGSAAEVAGRVVNETGEPLAAMVVLRGEGATPGQKGLAQSDKEDGRFAFTGLPPGAYKVVAHMPRTQLSARSDAFELRAGEEKVLPDLVLNTTNLPLVELQFVLPDGQPAANVCLVQFNITADSQGRCTERLPCGTYRDMRAMRDDEAFITDAFTIAPDTRALTVRLQSLPQISGTVTLDGQPLLDGWLNCTPEHGAQQGISVSDGRFTLAAQPGTYMCSRSQPSASAVVTLHEGDDNVIALARGTANLSFDFPADERWSVSAALVFGENRATLGHIAPRTCGARRMTGLPAGDYSISAYRMAGQNTATSMTTRLSLRAGSDTPVRF